MISRDEFHQRNGQISYDVKRMAIEELDVKTLFKEAKADAPFRSHNYMFAKNVNFSEIKEQEKDGIAKKYPRIRNEQRRFDLIQQELETDAYDPVQILKHYKHPTMIFIANGFHRIFLANKLGWKTIKCNVKYVDYNFSKNITMGDLSSLLKMLVQLFPQKETDDYDLTTVNGLSLWLDKQIKLKPDIKQNMSICFGSRERI